jgi:hypothetical protein
MLSQVLWNKRNKHGHVYTSWQQRHKDSPDCIMAWYFWRLQYTVEVLQFALVICNEHGVVINDPLSEFLSYWM